MYLFIDFQAAQMHFIQIQRNFNTAMTTEDKPEDIQRAKKNIPLYPDNKNPIETQKSRTETITPLTFENHKVNKMYRK